MLTAKDGEHDVAEALDTGADDYLAEAVLARGARWPGSAPCCAAAASNVRWCSRWAICVSIRPRTPAPAATPADRAHGKEFAVLEYLMRHAGTAVSKSELLAHAWDVNFDGDRERRRGPPQRRAPQDRRPVRIGTRSRRCTVSAIAWRARHDSLAAIGRRWPLRSLRRRVTAVAVVVVSVGARRAGGPPARRPPRVDRAGPRGLRRGPRRGHRQAGGRGPAGQRLRS